MIEFGDNDELQVNYEETDRELARLSAKIRQVGKLSWLIIINHDDDSDDVVGYDDDDDQEKDADDD